MAPFPMILSDPNIDFKIMMLVQSNKSKTMQNGDTVTMNSQTAYSTLISNDLERL